MPVLPSHHQRSDPRLPRLPTPLLPRSKTLVDPRQLLNFEAHPIVIPAPDSGVDAVRDTRGVGFQGWEDEEGEVEVFVLGRSKRRRWLRGEGQPLHFIIICSFLLVGKADVDHRVVDVTAP